MSLRDLIMFGLLIVFVAACTAQIPDAMDYETKHQRHVASKSQHLNQYGIYKQFTDANK